MTRIRSPSDILRICPRRSIKGSGQRSPLASRRRSDAKGVFSESTSELTIVRRFTATFTFTVLFVGILAVVSINSGHKLYASPLTEMETARFELASAVDLAKGRLASLEGAASVAPLEDSISNYEIAVFRDALELAEPWMLLGDAYLQAGNPQAAATAYEQSIHITRVNLGLFTPDQLETVHRQAALFDAMGDTEGATAREEYALVLQRKKFGKQPDVLPALRRMADWYIKVSKPASARHLYEEAINILRAFPDAQPGLLAHAYVGLAESYRLERFPAQSFFQKEERDFTWQGPDPNMSRWDLSQGMFFGPANRALLNAEEVLRSNVEASSGSIHAKERLSEVMVRLGDLNILFEKWSTANNWYSSVFDLWSEPEEQASAEPAAILEQWFDQPTPLHLPLPREIGPVEDYPAERVDVGHITLAFSLSSHGKVGRIETLEIYPDHLRDLRFRRVLRESRYRPQIERGKAVKADRVVHRHEFLYVVKEKSDEDAPPPNAPEEQS